MARSRFVSPRETRLSLADVHKRAHADLIASFEKDNKGKSPTSADREKQASEIDASAARVEQAIADNDWITIKHRLNTGEQRNVFAQMARDINPGGQVALKPEQVGKTKIAEYLIGWSFVDDDGRPVAYAPEQIDNLDPDTYREIREAIDWHEEQVEKEIADRAKNALSSTRAGEPSSEPISLSAAR